uniref:Uncharacterized protein n=1 Tax=Peronospora matthiolae TaxID=2874970 RepID=A0AAV1UG70_9STRA
MRILSSVTNEETSELCHKHSFQKSVHDSKLQDLVLHLPVMFRIKPGTGSALKTRTSACQSASRLPTHIECKSQLHSGRTSALAPIVTHPLDVVHTRSQLARSGENRRGSSPIVHAAVSKGCGCSKVVREWPLDSSHPRVVRVAPAGAIVISTFRAAKSLAISSD